MMIIVDAHQDIAYNLFQHGRDWIHSVWQQRVSLEDPLDPALSLPANGLPDALLGRVAVVFATLYAAPKWAQSRLNFADSLVYETAEQAYRVALRQWDYYQRLSDEQGRVDLVRTQAELDAVLATWAEGTGLPDHHIGLVLLMEGADPVIEPRQLEEWYGRGLRVLGPAWSETRYAGGTNRPGPLTDLGRDLLDAMADYNMILDLSHLTAEGYSEALDRYTGPVIASHSNPTAFYDNERNLTDAQIRRLAERDGVVGINFYNRFLSPTWTKGDHVPFTAILDAIDYVCQVTGSAAHVGIGSDVDGGFGADLLPDGIDTVTDFWRVGAALAERGFAQDDVAAILGGNFLRVLRRALP